MIPWLACMALCLILAASVPADRGPKLRVCAAMLAGLPLAFIYPSAWTYMAIDLSIAAIVMRQPKGVWQRFIGFCYTATGGLYLGFLIREFAGVYIFSSPITNVELLKVGNDLLIWLATIALLLWCGNGVLAKYCPDLRNRLPWLGGVGDLSPASERGI